MKSVTIGACACWNLSLHPPPSISAPSPRRLTTGSPLPGLHPSASLSLPPSGIRRAALRFHESNRLDPLLIDPYAACFLPPTSDGNSVPPAVPGTSHHVLATGFIDGKLLEVMGKEEIRQVVLLTDGMDTRPYRLRWPISTLIYDVSPAEVFCEASRRLEGVGAKLARTCMLFHIPFESSDLRELLCRKGFSGSRPSIWILQGLPLVTLAKFEELLSVVSALAMEGCIFLGELPVRLVEAKSRNETSGSTKWMNRTFMSHGFRVDVLDYVEIRRKVGCSPLSGNPDSILFVAHQLRLSDEQMEKWRMEFQRIDEEGDEEGFEDMIV